jgi:hypothetical protein
MKQTGPQLHLVDGNQADERPSVCVNCPSRCAWGRYYRQKQLALSQGRVVEELP